MSENKGTQNKKLIMIGGWIVAILVIVLMIKGKGFSFSGNSPEKVVHKMMKAIHEKDVDDFLKCVAPDVKEEIMEEGRGEVLRQFDMLNDEYLIPEHTSKWIKYINCKEVEDGYVEVTIDGSLVMNFEVDKIKGKYYVTDLDF